MLIDALTQRRDLGQQPEHQLTRRCPTRQRDPLGLLNAHTRKIPSANKESSHLPRPHLNTYERAALAGRPLWRFRFVLNRDDY